MPSSLKELQSSGGGLSIDDIVVLNATSNVYSSADGTVWLKSGYEQDASLYPEAHINENGNVGLPSAATDSNTGFPIYVRVK